MLPELDVPIDERLARRGQGLKPWALDPEREPGRTFRSCLRFRRKRFSLR